MGQQQLLLIVLGVIIVGVAIVAGIALFNSGSVEATKDELVSQNMNIAANAQQWYKKPKAMGGGGEAFTGYIIPQKMTYTTGGTYVALVAAQSITLTATPKNTTANPFTVVTTVEPDTMYTVVNETGGK
ncbi:MAG: hypothetical protein ACM3O3_07580 [Syntrophothermus sp.]